jgi:phage recombination protein Bet
MAENGDSTALAPIIVTNEQRDLVRRTVASGATADELELYFYDCRRQGVHPLDKLLHFTKRKGRYTPITSIDLMRIRAHATGECAGISDATFFEGKPFPEKATVTVCRIVQGQPRDFTATARWSEYYPGDGDVGFMWRKMPHVMLGKVAEALALRKGFPQQLAGLYAAEEMDQVNEPAVDTRKRSSAKKAAASLGDDSGSTQAAGPTKTTFEIQGRPYTTAGLTRDQLLESFNLVKRCEDMAGEGSSVRIFAELFPGRKSRTQLTKAEGDRYRRALRRATGEMVDDEPVDDAPAVEPEVVG